jgi:hypothetical protein
VSSFSEEAIDNELYEEWPRQYSPNELAKIAEALGLKSLSSEMEEDLQEIAEGYCWTDLCVPRKGEPEVIGLRSRTRNDHLRRIAKLAGQLARCHQNSAEAQAQFGELLEVLTGVDLLTSQLLETEYTDDQLQQLADRLGEPEANAAFADLKGAAERALERTKRPGRPRERRYDLVEDLADFYEQHTGKEPGRNGPDGDPGPFERLVLAALEPLEPAARDPAALPRIRDGIRTVLEARRAKKSSPHP